MNLSETGDDLLESLVTMRDYKIERFLSHHTNRHQVKQSISNSFNPNLLENVRKALWSVNHHSTGNIREQAEIHRQKAENLNKEYEPPFKYQSLGTFTDSEVDVDKWRSVYSSQNVSELLDSAVFIQAETDTPRCEYYRILKGFAFYKSEDEEHLKDALNLNDYGTGLDSDTAARRISKTLLEINPVIGGLLCGYIKKVTTNTTDSSNSYGSAKDDGRWLNILSDTSAGGVSTVAHEIGHAVQYAFGINCNSSIDNRDATEEFEKNYSVKTKDKIPFSDFQTEIKYLWDVYTDGNLPEVRSYQQKNFNEFFACAFEYWATSNTPTEYEVFFNKHLTQ